MSNTWAIICGAIRSRFEFDITVREVLSLRAEGLVSTIIVSVWNTSFKEFPDLREALRDAGILVVAVPEIREGGNGQTFRQHRLLDAALTYVPEKTDIIKLRTDKCLHRIRFFRDRLKAGLIPVQDTQDPFTVFQKKIAVMSASTTLPFVNSDVVFIAQKEDIRSLIHMDRYFDWVAFPGSINAEMRWFMKPFHDQIEIFRPYFELFNCRLISGEIIDRLSAQQADQIPDFFWQVMAAHMICLTNNFDIVSQKTPVPDHDAEAVFNGSDRRVSQLVHITNARHVTCYSNDVPANIIEGRLINSPATERLSQAVRILKADHRQGAALSLNDLNLIKDTFLAGHDFSPIPTGIGRYATHAYSPKGQQTPFDLDHHFPDVDPGEATFLKTYFETHGKTKAFEILALEVADLYLGSEDLPTSPEDHEKWLRVSADSRHAPAQYKLAALLINSDRSEEGISYLEKAAATGHQEAQTLLLQLKPGS